MQINDEDFSYLRKTIKNDPGKAMGYLGCLALLQVVNGAVTTTQALKTLSLVRSGLIDKAGNGLTHERKSRVVSRLEDII